jgi:hypothetical protein
MLSNIHQIAVLSVMAAVQQMAASKPADRSAIARTMPASGPSAVVAQRMFMVSPGTAVRHQWFAVRS